MKLQKEYYQHEDVVHLARELLGKVIHTNFNGQLTSGVISETEAYAGISDRASHAFDNRRTLRTETLYQDGGIAYVYLCYGVHHLFNFVTNVAGIPHAVLLRGIIPRQGIDVMEKRVSKRYKGKQFSDGPGKLTKALAIKTVHDGMELTGETIWVEDAGIEVRPEDVLDGPRIGVDYAGKDAKLPYRFLWTIPGLWIQKTLK